MLVLEKGSGKVQRVINGVLQPTPALDLAVNSASERGLLGVALHPRFPRDPRVYLYWTESTARDAAGAPIDTTDLASTPLLGNRVDSFLWNGRTLRFDRNLIRLRAFQADAGQPLRGNHNGGILRFEMNRDDDDHRGRDCGDDDHAMTVTAAATTATTIAIAGTTTGTRPGCSSSSATTAGADRRRTS